MLHQLRPEEQDQVDAQIAIPLLAGFPFTSPIPRDPERAERARVRSGTVVLAQRRDLLQRHGRPVVLPQKREDEEVRGAGEGAGRLFHMREYSANTAVRDGPGEEPVQTVIVRNADERRPEDQFVNRWQQALPRCRMLHGTAEQQYCRDEMERHEWDDRS